MTVEFSEKEREILIRNARENLGVWVFEEPEPEYYVEEVFCAISLLEKLGNTEGRSAQEWKDIFLKKMRETLERELSEATTSIDTDAVDNALSALELFGETEEYERWDKKIDQLVDALREA